MRFRRIIISLVLVGLQCDYSTGAERQAPAKKARASGNARRLSGLLSKQSLDVLKRSEPLQLRGHRDKVWQLAFFPGRPQLASIDDDGEVILWNLSTGRELSQNKLSGFGRSVAFGLEGRLFASTVATPWDGGFSGSMELLDLRTQQKAVVKSDDAWSFSALSVHSTRGLVATSALQALRIFRAEAAWAKPKGKGKDQTLEWQIPEVTPPAPAFSDEISALDWHPVQDVVAVGCKNGDLRMARVGNQGVETLDTKFVTKTGHFGHRGRVEAVSFHPDGDRLLSASGDGTLVIWDAETGKLVKQSWDNANQRVFSSCFSPCGTLFAAGFQDGRVRIFDLASEKYIELPGAHTATVHDVAFSEDGMQLASSGADFVIKVWTLFDAKELRKR